MSPDRHPSAPTSPVEGSRLLVVSQREIQRELAYTSWAEGEDVLLAHGGAALHPLARPASAPTLKLRRSLGRNARRFLGPHLLLPALPWRPEVHGHHDAAIVTLKSVWDIPVIEAVRGLRKAVGGVIGWFPEMWPSQLSDRLALHPFSLLDEIFVGEPRSAGLLAELLKRPVHFLPLATDVEIYSDRTGAGASGGHGRPIDVLNIGRREPGLHETLLRWSRESGRYYVFDTTGGARATDWPAHRRALSDQLQRTSVAISSYARQGTPETAGIRWVAGRVFDNLASGTILAGDPPDVAHQLDLFGREVVHPIPTDPVRARRMVAELVASATDDERVRNQRTAQAGHDWSHRWIALLETCGLRPSDSLAARAAQLRRQGVDGPAAGGRPDLRPPVEAT